MPPDRTVSVVVPVYNSAPNLEELAERLSAALPAVCRAWEIILVNDGSRDESWTVIQRLAGEHPCLCGFNMMRNYGQHNALLCGIRAARYDLIVTMDDDLQHPPEAIGSLLERLDEGYDVVYAPPIDEQHGLWRDVASQFTKLALQSTMGVDAARKVSSYRALRTQVRDAFAGYNSPFVAIDVLLTWGTNRFSAMPVEHAPRKRGQSNYTFRMLVRHAVNLITGFSIVPLQLASLLGFGFALFGVLVLIYVVGRYLLQGSPVPGFPFLASTIAIFSGVQLFALGIIGEYMARMHFRLMDRPGYVIREQTPAKEKDIVP